MKKAFILILSIALVPFYLYAGSQYYGCDKKINQLERQRDYAKKYGNTHRVYGLEKAIANVQAQCYDHYSGATGATRLNERYYSHKTLQLEQDIEVLKDEIARLKNLKN